MIEKTRTLPNWAKYTLDIIYHTYTLHRPIASITLLFCFFGHNFLLFSSVRFHRVVILQWSFTAYFVVYLSKTNVHSECIAVFLLQINDFIRYFICFHDFFVYFSDASIAQKHSEDVTSRFSFNIILTQVYRQWTQWKFHTNPWITLIFVIIFNLHNNWRPSNEIVFKPWKCIHKMGLFASIQHECANWNDYVIWICFDNVTLWNLHRRHATLILSLSLRCS